MKPSKILAIDPSGTGTSGIFFTNGTQEQFSQFTSKEWKEHYQFILAKVKETRPTILLFENTNWVNLRGKDMTFLLKLLGALESLVYLNQVATVVSVPVNQVKGLRGKLLKGSQTIAEISYQPGKGWHYQNSKISTHELDAYLVYFIWNNKPKELWLN